MVGYFLTRPTPLPTSMNGDQSTVGQCPECGSSISSGWKLIEYERDDGPLGIFAECPSCNEVVAPE